MVTRNLMSFIKLTKKNFYILVAVAIACFISGIVVLIAVSEVQKYSEDKFLSWVRLYLLHSSAQGDLMYSLP